MKRAFVLLFLVAVSCAPAWGGLAGYTGWTDPDTSFTWEGVSQFYVDLGGGDVLAASVEWVVPWDWQAGKFHYVYQMTNTGTVDITKLGVLMRPSNEAQGYGWFPLAPGTLAPSGIGFDLSSIPPFEPTDAYWTFEEAQSLRPGQITTALEYWSVNKPLAENGFIQNSGESADGNWDLPSPDNEIPEPACMTLLAVCATALLKRRR